MSSRAAIIAVGQELLGTNRLDTNSLVITGRLEKYGISTVRKAVVGDGREEIAREVDRSLEDADLLLITGGLGPTEDDCTKEGVAKACGLELETDEGILGLLRERFARRGMEMPEVNARQAQVFAGQRTIENPRGTAPGFHIVLERPGGSRNIWIFPGVPWEMKGMLDDELEPWLRSVAPARGGVHRRIVRISGMGESAVEQKLEPYYDRHRSETLTILSTENEIQLHLRAIGGASEAVDTLNGLERELREIFGERIYGTDDDSLESVLGRMLIERGETVATAESCTGGLVGSRITDVSGSSAYYFGGVVAYSRDAKISRLGIEPELLDRHGEVSEETARRMAELVRERFGSTHGIGTTGIAGPTGGTEGKPVGTVHVAVASPKGVKHRVFVLPPPRSRVKTLTTQIALDLLRVAMLRGQA